MLFLIKLLKPRFMQFELEGLKLFKTKNISERVLAFSL